MVLTSHVSNYFSVLFTACMYQWIMAMTWCSCPNTSQKCRQFTRTPLRLSCLWEESAERHLDTLLVHCTQHVNFPVLIRDLCDVPSTTLLLRISHCHCTHLKRRWHLRVFYFSVMGTEMLTFGAEMSPRLPCTAGPVRAKYDVSVPCA